MADSKKTSDRSKAAEKQADEPPRKDGTRETIESIVIAFIFAFLFRTFEAEAFVIPTGSMAPTLLGRHKDEVCPKCGFQFRIGASEELDREGHFLMQGKRIDRAVCPNCRFELKVRTDPVFIGDRILVTKFNPEIGDTDRWDVTVFKFPEDPTVNYIKRLCGLPGETIEIRQGDLYRIDDGKAEILRKPNGAKQRAVLQTVYDDDLPCREMLEAGWPERWSGVAHDGGPNAVAGWSDEVDGWASDESARTYHVEADGTSRWLRYRHFVPTREDWEDLPRGPLDPKARLILDFCGYNAIQFEHGFPPEDWVYWVGDLAMSATIDVQSAQRGGSVTLELVEGNRKYRCTLDPNAETATLSYVDALDREQKDEAARVLSEAPIDFAAGDSYEVAFANVDNQLWLWIDGDAVEFPTSTYQPFGGQLIQLPGEDDLTPIGIAATNVTATVSHLKVSRDVYYRADFADPASANLPDFQRSSPQKEAGTDGNENRLRNLADDPEAYADLYKSVVRWLKPDGGVANRLVLGADEFLMLGDNSPRSLDGRLWGNLRGDVHRHAVPRSALVGKALLIFWPHGLRLGNEHHGVPHGYTIPGLDRFFYHTIGRYDADGNPVATGIARDYPAHGIPFYPNFARILRRIR